MLLTTASRWKMAIIAGAFILTSLTAYLPALNNGFIWDDDYYVTRNSNLTTFEGLKKIWLVPSSSPQYYPLVFTTFWVEYHIWELDPRGYHLVNILLHALNALLLWMVLARLGVCGALPAALVFLLHPVHVESVAWVAELKNTQSAFFYLSSMLLYLRYLGIQNESANSQISKFEDNADWRLYIISILLYICALLSKTVTSTMPAAILLLLWWKRERLLRSDYVKLAPFFY